MSINILWNSGVGIRIRLFNRHPGASRHDLYNQNWRSLWFFEDYFPWWREGQSRLASWLCCVMVVGSHLDCSFEFVSTERNCRSCLSRRTLGWSFLVSNLKSFVNKQVHQIVDGFRLPAGELRTLLTSWAWISLNRVQK